MKIEDFHQKVEIFCASSSLPSSLWRRQVDKARANTSDFVMIPGRAVFRQSSDGPQPATSNQTKDLTQIMLLPDSVSVIDPDGKSIALKYPDFKPDHLAFANLNRPPLRQQRIAATRKLTELAASFMNQLALADPYKKSKAADWFELCLAHIRAGIVLSLSPEAATRRLSDQVESGELRASELDNIIRQLDPKHHPESHELMPPWIEGKSLNLSCGLLQADYSEVSGSSLGANLFDIGVGSSRSGIWGHLSTEDSVRSVIDAALEHAFSISDQNVGPRGEVDVFESLFFDPTDSPGSFLAEAIEALSESLEATAFNPKPENFVSIVSTDELVLINEIVIWFSLCRVLRSGGAALDAFELKEIWTKIGVHKADQLVVDWGSYTGETDNLIVVTGAPKFAGTNKQSAHEKDLVKASFGNKKVDLSACWVLKGAQYVSKRFAISAFAVTNSVTQGSQVSEIWPKVFTESVEILFAKQGFRWGAKKASGSASGVTAVIIGLGKRLTARSTIYSSTTKLSANYIGPYLVPEIRTIVVARNSQISGLPKMVKGNMPFGAEQLIFDRGTFEAVTSESPKIKAHIRQVVGSEELSQSSPRYCIWIPSEDDWAIAKEFDFIRERVDAVRKAREQSTNQKLASEPWRFREIRETKSWSLAVPSVTSEARDYIPMSLVGPRTIVTNLAFAVYEAPPWLFALLMSSMHHTWLRFVSGGLETRIRYSNVLSYNTFPVPELTPRTLTELNDSAVRIIRARSLYPEISLGSLYSTIPNELRQAHLQNDRLVNALYGLGLMGQEVSQLTAMLERYEELILKDAN